MTDSQFSAPIRLGYVGCGFMAQHVHLPNYATLPQCRLLAIAERRPQLGLAVARRFAVERVYSSHLELAADPQIDYPVVSSEHDWNYRAEAAHFLTSLQTGQPFVSSGEDALIDVWLNEQIYKKHLEATTV